MGLTIGNYIGIGKNSGVSWSTYCTPTNLVATEISDSRIDLAWDDAAEAADGLRVYISTDNSIFTEHGTANFGDEAYSVTGLTDGIIYYFKLVAYKGTNESTAITDNACTIPSKFLGATAKVWYDYTDAALKTVSGGRVSQVNDKTANALHQTMGVAGEKPYDLGADGIQGRGAQRIGNTTALGVDGNCSIFAVARLDTIEALKTLFSGAISIDVSATKLTQLGWNPFTINAPANGTWFLLTSINDNATTDILQINNGAPVTATKNSHLTPVNSVLGVANDTEFIKASIKALILISEVLATGDITKAKNYLNWKYEVFF